MHVPQRKRQKVTCGRGQSIWTRWILMPALD